MEGQEIPQIWMEKGDGAYWADAALNAERPRIAASLRIKHLARTGRVSPDTEEFMQLCLRTEAFADKRLANFIVTHPTWPWASLIKGVGQENYPKVIGLIEKFGRFYDVGDPMIPSYIRREPESYLKDESGKVVEKVGIWVKGIERLPTPSKLYKYMGFDVDPKTGHAPRRKAGEKLGFNAELRMAMYRLSSSLLRAKGIWYLGGAEPGCSPGYQGYRQRIVDRKEAEGVNIVATPTERMCLRCDTAVKTKKAQYCPKCGDRLTLKTEPPGVLFLGHLHQMAMREMAKDFILCFWLVWREALGLPVTEPYKVVKLDHRPIDPWKMVDQKAEKGEKAASTKRATVAE